ncbi:hypothetical protein [Limnochorda pilosa]|uniref:hypothetical protein n=1 Tax=Limnochorda pilosa TaxID=1555112 RepID=UPI00130EBAB0|nr:hypothetical protein [Limnochorda pilosa]
MFVRFARLVAVVVVALLGEGLSAHRPGGGHQEAMSIWPWRVPNGEVPIVSRRAER